MELTQLSVNLAVKDLRAARRFYQTLGFRPVHCCGSVQQQWLLMQQGGSQLGLYQDLIDANILSFRCRDLAALRDHLQRQGLPLPASQIQQGYLLLEDPDGNSLLFEQY